MNDSYMQVLADQNRIKLDPRTKIFMLLIINVSAFSVSAWYVMALAAVIPISLFALSKRFYLALVFTILYSSSLLLYVYLIDSSFGIVNIVVGMLIGVINRMGPGLLMGYYLLSTTTVSEFIAAMERINLPKQIIISLSVMFRFFPTIKEESSSINDAMRMRNIGFGPGNYFKEPLAMIEYRIIPLLMSTVKIGEELSAAALTRGLDTPGKRTNICHIGFGFQDSIYITAVTTLFIVFNLF
jgi:energy-coupling factor transport system permease protein